MLQKLLLTGLLWIGISSPADANTATPNAPMERQWQLERFELIGSGNLRWGYVIELYQAALSLGDQGTLWLEIRYRREISAELMEQAAEHQLRSQLGDAAFAEIRPAFEQLHDHLTSVAAGDRYGLLLRVDGELVLLRNDREIYRSEDAPLGRAYLAMWLGEQPIDASLRAALLAIGNEG